MNTLIHADIFFFVTTIVVVIVGILLIVALVYLIQLLRQIKGIAGQVHEEAILFREDIHGLRDSVKREGLKLNNILNFGYKIFDRFTSRKKTKRSKDEK